MMRESIKLMRALISKGSISDREDAELFRLASLQQVREELEIFSEEWDFRLITTSHNIYIVPLQDNDFFNVKLSDIRKSVSASARNIDAYLQCYIIMVIIWMFYGTQNTGTQYAESLRVRHIVDKLDERFSGQSTMSDIDDMNINFVKLAEKWNNSLMDEEGKKSKTEFVRTACRFLESQKLIRFYDDGDEIRPTLRLTDLMHNYYLDEKRISDIHRIFEKEAQ